MKIMAIDYGDAHTGIAVSDALLTLAGFTTVITAYRPEAVAAEIMQELLHVLHLPWFMQIRQQMLL